MKPLTGIKWLKRNTYFWIEDESEAALIRGWVEHRADKWRVEIRAAVCGIYITAYYEKKKDALAVIPELLRAMPDEWQAAIGRLP